jgi:uncharacterized metal-binding protein YceD (DUF177 family)
MSAVGGIPANEFSVVVKMDDIGAGASQHVIAANAVQCAAVAQRFLLISLESLTASLSLAKTAAGIMAKGRISANAVQACIATGDPVPVKLDEPLEILFIPEPREDGEFELDASDCDTMFHDGKGVDIGEAVVQTFGLALDPYPRSSDAETILRKAGVKSEDEERAASGPFAGLAALKSKLTP